MHRELDRSKGAMGAKELIRRYTAGERDLHKAKLSEANLAGANLSEPIPTPLVYAAGVFQQNPSHR